MERRDFLKTACITSAGLLTGCPTTPSGYQAERQNNKLVVPKTMIPSGGAIAVAWGKQRIGLSSVNDESFAATLMRCTHLGCGVEIEQGGYVCPCHGAKFTHTGECCRDLPQKICKSS